MTGHVPGIPFPEQGQPFSGVGIEVLLRSYSIPPEPRGFKLLELAQRSDWIESRRTVRKGLDQVELKHVVGPAGHSIDYITYYIATELVGRDGLPPVGGCNHSLPDGGGAGG